MVKIKDILRLKKDVVFGGAVQSEWFYEDRAEKIAENFVFHGPDFFGVTEEDIEFKGHKLMDTCTYTATLAQKLYDDDESSPIILTIAGYGTGKSHLSVTLGTLFSEDKSSKLTQKIIKNIKHINKEIAFNIEAKMDKPNMILVLNGMKDFNLNYEIINSAKKALKKWGYSEEIFSEFTKAYNIAYRFLDKNYRNLEKEFVNIAKSKGIINSNLMQYMKENIYRDEVFDCINDVYKEFTGDYIRWDEGVSASEVLRKLTEKLCGDKGKFNKILILFDEFGRYIEYASEYPNRAGDSALQQLFEVIQDSDKKIIFNAFIQSDLKTYLSRVNKSSSISRYIGRYDAGEKIYLSSNLETIFANLIGKYDMELFTHNIKDYFNKDKIDIYNRKVFDSINLWVEETRTRGIWSDYDKYKNVILEGIYPLNPLATWLITYLSDWYQQRSALNFLIKSFEKIEEKEILNLGDIPDIKAIDIIKGDLFEELLLAETEGRQRSEYCTIYDKIETKYRDKFNNIEQDVLAGILVLKLCKFKTSSIEDLNFALELVTGIKRELVEISINNLDDIYGVISYDDRNHTYDFVEDATGKNDFLRMIRKKKANLNVTLESLFNSDTMEKLGIESVLDTDFSKRNYIKTNEWKYSCSISTVNELTEFEFKNMIKDFKSSTSPEKNKGKLIYLYNNMDSNSSDLENIIELCRKLSINKYPIIIVLVDDKKNELYESLINDRISKLFTHDENAKYSRYIARFINETVENLKDIFKKIMLERLFVTENGIEKKEKRVSIICGEKFIDLYPNVIPFDFVGFEKKNSSIAKKVHLTISKLIIQKSISYQTISTLSIDVVNRIQSVLQNPKSGWGVLSNKDNNVNMISPTNAKVKLIFEKIDSDFYSKKEVLFSKLMEELSSPPYGLNDYSIALLMCVYISSKYYEAKLSLNGNIINNIEWANEIFTEKAIIYPKLSKSKLIKINIDGYKLAFRNLCSKIEVNNDVDQCLLLNEELQKLLKEAEPPEELIEKIEGCKLILEDGIKAYRKVTDKIGQLEGKLSNAMDEASFKDIISLIIETEEINNVIEENSRYIYNQKYENRVRQLNSKARKMVENEYEIFLNTKCKCRVVEQATKFESWMKFLRDNLKKAGYVELSKKTHYKLLNELDNLQLVRERQNVEQNVESYTNKIITKFLTEEELISLEKEGTNLVSNLKMNNKLSNTDKSILEHKINQQLDLILKFRSEIKEKLNEIYDLMAELEDIEQVRILKSKIEYILDKKLNQTDRDDIEAVGNSIQNFLNDMKNINMEDNTLLQVEMAEQMKIKYSDDENVDLGHVIQGYIDGLNDTILNKSNDWEKKYLNYCEEEISKWDTNTCYSWLDQTNILPNYVQENCLIKYRTLREHIIERTSQLKLESILVIFNKLNQQEKIKCIKVLKTIL